MKTPLRTFIFLLLFWGSAAAVAGWFKLFSYLPPRVIPVVVAGLTIGLSLAITRVEWLRRVVSGLSVRTIVAAHLVRFLGAYFLWLHAQGRLPAEFANRAGWGDLLAAAGAVALLFWPEGAGFRRALFWWNIFGALDLLVAVGTGGWLNITRPGSMIELSGLPLTLVPLWIVPVLLASHLYLLRQHLRSTPYAGAGAGYSRTIS
jgi:hypothetical protein